VDELEMPLKASLSQVGGVSAKHWTSLSEEQSKKAYSPMIVTELGMVIEVRAEQREKA
jgi:hypothetical protein